MDVDDFNIQSCSAAPYPCIISTCKDLLCSSTVLSHFLAIHQKSDNVEFQDVALNEKVLMVVSTHNSFLQINQNLCLGVLGIQCLHSNDHYNALLKDDCKKFSNHIPVLIMACRGNYGEMYSAQTYDESDEYVCFWLAIPELKNNQKLCAVITVHDEDKNNSISSSVNARPINHRYQKVSEFMNNETDSLVINAGMLEKIGDEGVLFLEVIIKEKLL